MIRRMDAWLQEELTDGWIVTRRVDEIRTTAICACAVCLLTACAGWLLH